MALQKQKISIPLAGGQNDKIDPFQMSPSEFLSLENVIFKKQGQINKRNGFSNFNDRILSTSNSISVGYALSLFKNQLQLFDGNNMYSYLDSVDKWVDRGSMYSIDVSSDSIIRNDDTQKTPNMATNSGVSAYAWEDSRGGVRYTVVDESKNTTIVSDLEVSATGKNPQVFAMSNFLVIFYAETTNVKYRKISIADPSTLEAAVSVISDLDGTTAMYDMQKLRDRIYIVWHSTDAGGSVGIRYINSFFTVSSDTQYPVTSINKMVCALTDDVESKIWMFYTDNNILYGGIFDYELNELVAPRDVYPDGGVFARTASNFHRMVGKIENDAAEIFVEYENIGVDDPEILRMEVDNTATRTALENSYFFNVRLYSKIYEFQDEFFFIVHYESSIQPTYFVYNTNQQIVSKLLPGNSGDKLDAYRMCRNVNEPSTGSFKVPVQKKGRLVSRAISYVYTTLGIQSIELDHVSDKVYISSEAANNLHIAGGSLQMFDGANLVEHGFHLFPENTSTAASQSVGGSMADGTYSVLAVYKWVDNQGQVHRSAASIPQSVTVAAGGGTASIILPIKTLVATNKTDVIIEMYSTEDAGTIYYKTAEVDNDKTTASVTVSRTESDGNLLDNEILYTTGGVLENIAAPSCKLVVSHRNRLFVAGLESRNQIQYSKLVRDGFPVEFNDTLTIKLVEDGDQITAIESMDDKLIIFKNNSIYTLFGDGPNDLGLQDTFSDPQFITSDVGCTDTNSVVSTPVGLMFKSDKGIYLLSRSLQVSYIGAPVESYNTQTITSSTLLADKNEVRFTTNNDKTLVFNYFFQRWSVFTNYSAIDSLVYNDQFAFLTSAGVVNQENSGFTDNGRYIKLKLVTAWLSFAGLQGFQRIYSMLILGDYISAHSLRIKAGFDFNDAFIQDVTKDMEALVASNAYGDGTPYGTGDSYYGGQYIPYQLKVHTSIQKCQSIRFSIEDIQSTNLGEGMTLSNLNLTVGIKSGDAKTADDSVVGTS